VVLTKSVANAGVLALGWIVSAVGCLVIVGALTALYFLLVKGVPPGQPIFLDVLAPPLQGAVLHLANGIALTFAPFILRWAIRRWRLSRTGAASDER